MKNKEIRGLAALKDRFGTCKYVLLVMAVGLVLLLWPQKDGREEANAPEAATAAVSAEALEEKLERKLSKIAGAGPVTVVLTLEQGTQYRYATDKSADEGGREERLVVISEGSGKENPLTETEYYPTFRGALVICSGGGDPNVRLQITQAVAVLTGLGTDRITVCEGN